MAGSTVAAAAIGRWVMHFHPDPFSDDAVDKPRAFTTLLHQYRDLA